MSEPLFSCQEQCCAESVSFHAADLHLYDGKPICEACFIEGITWGGGGWHDLPPFIPEYQKQIELLRNVVFRVLALTNCHGDHATALKLIKKTCAPYAPASEKTEHSE